MLVGQCGFIHIHIYIFLFTQKSNENISYNKNKIMVSILYYWLLLDINNFSVWSLLLDVVGFVEEGIWHFPVDNLTSN